MYFLLKTVEHGTEIKHSNKKKISKIIQLFNGQWLKKRKYHSDIIEKEIMQKKFIQQYFDIFYINNEEDIKKLNDITDIFVSGSDQIWNPYFFNPVNMLSIADDNKKKISFGSSVGIKHIPKEYHQQYIRLLNRYDHISVRENQSKRALNEIISKEITEVVDPTLLLNAKQWEFLTDYSEIDKKIFKEKYILCYFVGKRKSYWKYIEKIRKKTGYKVIVLPINNESYVNKFQKYVKVTPKEFLWMIKNAEIVCTDSFHATLFSIQYGKEFYTLKRFIDNSKNSQNGRLTDLLQKCNLSERLINDERDFYRSEIRDYDLILKKIDIDREKAKLWLKRNLEE